MAVVDSQQVAVPYKPVVLKIPERKVYGGKLLVFLLGVTVVVSGTMALFFFVKGRQLQRQLKEEIRTDESKFYNRVD